MPSEGAERRSQRAAELVDRRLLGVGLLAWTIIGVTLVGIGVLWVLAAVSELVMPLVFAVMIGIVAYPMARWLQARGLRPSISALLAELALILTAAGVAVLAVRAIVRQTAEMADYIDQAIEDVSDPGNDLGMSAETLERIRDALEGVAGVVGRGLLTAVVGGVGAVIGFIGSLILGLLLMYYVLKDGPDIRRWMIGQTPERYRDEAADFITSAVRAVRSYWTGRAMLSAVVTAVVVIASIAMGLPLIATIAVVNFFGGFVPYIGAFIGGGLATLLAIADGGIAMGLVMLSIVLVANLVLENVLEPRIMSGRLRIHPLLVLIATTVGGVVGGITGLVLAVPMTVVGIDLVSRIRRIYRGAVT